MRRLRLFVLPIALAAMIAPFIACGGGASDGGPAAPAIATEQEGGPAEMAPAPEPMTGETGQAAETSDEPLLIGVAGPFTGPSAQFGFQIEKGVQVARDLINEAGGVLGREVQIVQVDDEGNASAASTVARDLAQNPDVLAVVGHFNSRCSLNGREIYDEAGIVMLSPGSTNSTICAGSEWAFRNIFHDEFQGQTMAQYAHQILGHETVGVLYENDDYGRGLFGHFRDEAERIGLEIVAEAAYDNTTGDFIPLVRRVSSEQPDIILISGLYEQAARIAQAREELGVEIPLLGSDGVFSDEYMTLAGDAANGTLITTPFLFELAGQRAEGFIEAYKEKWPDAEPDAWAALAYDAFRMIAWAIESAGPDRTAIRDFLASIDTPEEAYSGLTGETYFDENGDCRKPIQVAIVRDGRFDPAPQQF